MILDKLSVNYSGTSKGADDDTIATEGRQRNHNYPTNRRPIGVCSAKSMFHLGWRRA